MPAVAAYKDHCQTAQDVIAARDATIARRRAFFAQPVAAPKQQHSPRIQFWPTLSGNISARLDPAPFYSFELRPMDCEEHTLTIKEVQLAVCRATKIRLKNMISPRRHMPLIGPRHIAMALSERLTKKGLSEIGRLFGGRDHTTVSHAMKKLEPVILDIEAVIEARMPLLEIVSAALKSFERLKPPPAPRRPKGQFAPRV